MIACDLATGEVKWESGQAGAMLDMAPQRRDASTVLAPPVLYGGRVVACGVDGVMYQLNADSGDCEGTMGFASPITAAPVPLEDGIGGGHLGWSAQAVRRLNGRLPYLSVVALTGQAGSVPGDWRADEPAEERYSKGIPSCRFLNTNPWAASATSIWLTWLLLNGLAEDRLDSSTTS